MFSDIFRLLVWYRFEKLKDKNEHMTMNSFIRRNETQT